MTKNLLFDLGGVIMDLQRMRCVHAFEALGMKDAGEMLGEYAQKGPFGQLESGAITPAGFRDEIRRHIDHPVTDKEIDEAFCEFLVGIPVKRLEELRRLRGQYKVYLLSNTNAIMWDNAIAEAFRQEGHDIGYYFDGIVTSYTAGCMKPSARIFDYTAEKLGIKPAETLFLDDSAANCKAAEALGWNAAVVPPGTEFMDILKEKGLVK